MRAKPTIALTLKCKISDDEFMGVGAHGRTLHCEDYSPSTEVAKTLKRQSPPQGYVLIKRCETVCSGKRNIFSSQGCKSDGRTSGCQFPVTTEVASAPASAHSHSTDAQTGELLGFHSVSMTMRTGVQVLQSSKAAHWYCITGPSRATTSSTEAARARLVSQPSPMLTARPP